MRRSTRSSAASLVILGAIILGGPVRGQAPARQAVAKVWDDAAMAALELPLARSDVSPAHVSADYYERIPIRAIYKSYPVYHPDKEPPGYLDWLRRQAPEVLFDASKLRSEADWVRAGELVFDAPIGFVSPTSYDSQICSFIEDVRDPEWYKATGTPLAEGGVMPFLRYVVRKPGVLELGELSCATCHTRVMPDGTVLKGAQGNFPFDRALAWAFRRHAPPGLVRLATRQAFTMPGLAADPMAELLLRPEGEIVGMYEAIPPGVLARQGSSLFRPPVIPDLIGLEDVHYLDRSGLVQHRDALDLMRYAALNQGADDLAGFGGFIPAAEDSRTRPAPETQTRYSDEQLYALALYVYSLKPPANPNRFDGRAGRGREVFRRERCDRCHPPPLYTSNELLPVDGFEPPAGHLGKFDVSAHRIDTDPELALKTRRGTGFYKVPSLRGVWYRGPFEHNGSVATLEDWFDARRTDDAYVPTGFRGPGKSRPVKGHRFGLNLSAEDRSTLIAFLKTL
jgi:hypothetical protein